MRNQIDAAQLRNIAKENKQSKTIFSALASRKRTRKITDLRQFQYKLLDEGAKLSKEDVLHTFKRLEKAGVGTLIIGRKNKPTRFEWNYSIKRVAKAASNSSIKSITEKKTDDSLPALVKEKPKKILTKSFITKSPSKKYTKKELHNEVNNLPLATISEKNIRAVISTTVKLHDNFSAKIEIPFGLTEEDADQLSELIYLLVQTKPKLEKPIEPSPIKIRKQISESEESKTLKESFLPAAQNKEEAAQSSS